MEGDLTGSEVFLGCHSCSVMVNQLYLSQSISDVAAAK